LEMKGLRPLAEAPFVEFQFVAPAAIESPMENWSRATQS
jgi:hypothetical protein